jgi:hypothetical protein
MTAKRVRMMCATVRTKSMPISALAKELGIHRATVYTYVRPDGTPTALGQALLAGTPARQALEAAAD